MFRYIDLFAGMGGIRLGLEQALKEKDMQGECVLTSEIKPHALKVYKDNFGEDNIVGDITKVEGKDIPDFDMLLAGFPCFIGETLVFTENGYKKIRDVKVGDKVLTHTNTYKEVEEVMEQSVDSYYNISLENNILIGTTENHPFYTITTPLPEVLESKEKYEPEWVRAGELKRGMLVAIPIELIQKTEKYLDAVYSQDNKYFWVRVRGKFKTVSRRTRVYNLCVKEDNSYTANDIIVHNCQPFSSAGKRAGFEDTRGTLFFEVARILKEKNPKYFLLENVENLVIHDLSKEDKKLGKTVGKTLETILYVLEELGYKVTWKVLQASDFGVPQLRRRIYIVGCKDRYISLDDFEKIDCKFGDIQEKDKPCVNSDFSIKLFDYLDKNNLSVDYLYDKAIRDKRGSSNNIHSWTLGLRGITTESQQKLMEKLVTERRRSDLAKKKGQPLKDGLGLDKEELKLIYEGEDLDKDIKYLLSCNYLKEVKIDTYPNILYDINGGRLSYEFTKILDPNKPSLTLVATDVHKTGVIDGKGIRKLTLREGLRLDGYPDDYKLDIDYNKGMDLLGNTVVVPVIKKICERVLADE